MGAAPRWITITEAAKATKRSRTGITTLVKAEPPKVTRRWRGPDGSKPGSGVGCWEVELGSLERELAKPTQRGIRAGTKLKSKLDPLVLRALELLRDRPEGMTARELEDSLGNPYVLRRLEREGLVSRSAAVESGRAVLRFRLATENHIHEEN